MKKTSKSWLLLAPTRGTTQAGARVLARAWPLKPETRVELQERELAKLKLELKFKSISERVNEERQL